MSFKRSLYFISGTALQLSLVIVANNSQARTSSSHSASSAQQREGRKPQESQSNEVVDSYLEQILCDNIQFNIWKEGLYRASKSKIEEGDLKKAFSENIYYSLMPGQEQKIFRPNMPAVFSKANSIVENLSEVALFFSNTIHDLFEKENQQRAESGKPQLSKEDFITQFSNGSLSLKKDNTGADYREWINSKIKKIQESTRDLHYGCAGNRNFIYRSNSRLGSVIDLNSFVIPATQVSANKIAQATKDAAEIHTKKPTAAVLNDKSTETKHRAEALYSNSSNTKPRTIRAQDMVGATFYFIPRENDPRYRGPEEYRIFDEKGKVIARVSESFYQALKIQGSGILSDGQTINFSRFSGGKRRYTRTSSTYGLGHSNNPLKPWRSIAIDFNYYKRHGINLQIGQSIYIPSTRGLKIPGSSPTQFHDGFWEIADVGQDIKGARIDMFTGTMHWKDALKYVNNPSNYNNGKRNVEANKLGSASNLITMQIVK